MVGTELQLFLHTRDDAASLSLNYECRHIPCRRVPCASLGAHHKGLGMLFFASCLTSFIAASTGEPGYIVDNQTVAKHDNYAQCYGADTVPIAPCSA